MWSCKYKIKFMCDVVCSLRDHHVEQYCLQNMWLGGKLRLGGQTQARGETEARGKTEARGQTEARGAN